MKGNRLYKYEKLCSRTAIQTIFSKQGNSAVSFPLRAVYNIKENDGTEARFLITVPKKKLHKAVERVLMRRRIREAYRLNRNIIYPLLKEKNKTIEIAFIYLEDKLQNYSVINSRMQSLLNKLSLIVNNQ